MSIRPIGKRVLIRRAKVEEKKNGIILVESSRQPKTEGEVIAMGDGITSVKIGDIVMYGNYSGVPVVTEDDDLVLLKEEEILCVME